MPKDYPLASQGDSSREDPNYNVHGRVKGSPEKGLLGNLNRAAAFFEAFRPPTPSRNFVSDHLKSINPIFVPPTTTFPPSPQASRYVFFCI